MTYAQQLWEDNNPTLPANAVRIRHMETGIGDAHTTLSTAEAVSVAGGLRGEVVPGSEPPVWQAATRTLAAAGRTWMLRFCPRRAWNLALARWEVTTLAGSDDAVELALYNGDLSQRLATSGVLTGQLNATGIKGVPLVYTVNPAQVYYLAFKAPVTLGSTGASVFARATNTTSGVLLFGSTVPTALAGFVDSLVSPLPASITASTINWTALSTFPLIALREI